jgi:hypothetical protein
MDGGPEPEREVTRVPTDADLVSLARELNRLGVAYVVIGGFAINRLGFVRVTEDNLTCQRGVRPPLLYLNPSWVGRPRLGSNHSVLLPRRKARVLSSRVRSYLRLRAG